MKGRGARGDRARTVDEGRAREGDADRPAEAARAGGGVGVEAGEREARAALGRGRREEAA